MKQRVLVAILTVLVFASGFAARVWTESTTALPPPPATIGSEFTPPTTPVRPPAPSNAKKLVKDRAQIIADIQKLGPQIAMFRAKMADIDAEFDRNFTAILNGEQRQHRAELVAASQKKHAQKAMNDPVPNNTAPLSDDEILSLQRQPLYVVLQWVTVTAKFDTMVEDYKLDADQQAKARKLIEDRRTQFLALVDSVTPWSILYSRLAPDVQRLAAPQK